MTIDECLSIRLRSGQVFYCGRCETAVDWEVKIAGFVVLLAKDAKKFLTLRVHPLSSPM